MNGFYDKMLVYISTRLSLCGYKYRKSESDFYKKIEVGAFSVSLDCLKASDGRHFVLNAICRIRIDDIEEVYAKYCPYLSDSEKKKHFTIYARYGNKPLFVNTLSKSFLPSESMEKADYFLRCFHDEIEPFFAKYSHREKLVYNLTSEDYQVWVTSDQICRYAILICNAAIEADREFFEAYAERFLQYCSKPFAQANLQLANRLVDGIRVDYF